MTNRRLNQVLADRAAEWINWICKMHNGIIGSKRNDQARDKYLCYTVRTILHLEETGSLFNLEDDDVLTVFLLEQGVMHQL